MSFHIENDVDYNLCFVGINSKLTETEHDELINELSNIKLTNLIQFMVYNDYEVDGMSIFTYAKLNFTLGQMSKFRNYLTKELNELNYLINNF